MTTKTEDDKIVCRIDDALTHNVTKHIQKFHPEWRIDEFRAFKGLSSFDEFDFKELLKWQTDMYQEAYPGAPIHSEYLISLAQKKKREAEVAPALSRAGFTMKTLAETFGFSVALKGVKNLRGEPINIKIMERDPNHLELLPDVDDRYVFAVDMVKTVLMGLETNMPLYLWGYHGTGKTTILEQCCARTNRPFMRIQHTANTEEAHILGQYIVRDGATEFQLGPLALAMLHGYVYCADEYDFAMPSVLSVYQPVLEGKPLYIKDAPLEMRLIRPHPNFRFVATGNTNGGGDETGLYQGTNIQNAANYSRFAIVEEVEYMPEKTEAAVIASQARIDIEDATKLVKFANDVRREFKAGKISSTISPREMINAGTIGFRKGLDYREGLRLAFMNRLSRVDREVINQFAQRVFG